MMTIAIWTIYITISIIMLYVFFTPFTIIFKYFYIHLYIPSLLSNCFISVLKPLFEDSIAKLTICDIASKWHLNGLNAGTHKQEESVNKYFKRIGKPYDYDLAVKHLKKVGLLVDKLDDGEILNCETEKAKKDAYTYGCGWITYTLPDKVVERVKEIIDRD